ncbi:Ger(x)C family spore germination protein [Paenibacillus sp. HB172176]|uniref:Ger(x)C family spore germination protein n=1 Tax=Paenibacillus sp. HB172176 TaxID=2493690 RepID=UPI00143BB291|nr:Ger(x)C family spore germination protein [Paenibacillus sp. HB172176]
MNKQRLGIVAGMLGVIMLLTACSTNRVVDHIHILTVMGFDKAKQASDGYIGTALYSDFMRRGGKINKIQGDDKQIRMILDEMNRQATQPVKAAKLRMIVFSKEIAQEGIGQFISSISKNPLVSHYLFVVVSENSMTEIADRLIGKESESLPYHMLEQNMKIGSLPFSNLSTVLFDCYGEGRDISVPYVRLNANGMLEASGYGIFHDEQLKSVLNKEEMMTYKLLQGYVMRGDTPIHVQIGDKHGIIVFTIENGHVDKVYSRQGSDVKLLFKLKLNAMMLEYPEWMSMNTDFIYKQLEKQTENRLQQRAKELLQQFQQEGTDPLGIGDYVRAHERNWEEKAFYESIYGKMKVEVDVKVKINKSGVGE